MTFNIVVGLIVPWLIGAWIYFKDGESVMLIAPFGSVLAWTTDQFGFHLGLWELLPLSSQDKMYSAWPYNLGLFPLSFCIMVYAARHTRLHPAALVLSSSLLLTFLEWLGVITGRVFYFRGWGIHWTFVSYLIPNILCFAYYRLLCRQGVMR